MIKQVNLNEKEISLIKDALMEKQVLSAVTTKYKKIINKLNKTYTTIQVSSRKAKGRNLQKWAVEKIAVLLNEQLSNEKDMNNIRSREMGQSGVDVWLHKSLLKKFPVAVECKAQEQIQMNAFIEQAKSNTSKDMPYWLLIIKNKILKNPIVVMDWELVEWSYKQNK